MTIFLTAQDGYVRFRFYDSDHDGCEEEFVKAYGSMPKVKEENAFAVMADIDQWYASKYDSGCVRFEFD